MNDSKPNTSRRIETICVHEGTRKDQAFNSVTLPIYFTSTFRFEGPGETKGYDYSRTANPTRKALEECLAALEGGASAVATATGMAAEATVMHLFKAGDHIISGHDIYGGTYRLFADVLSERGLSFSFVDMRNPDNVTQAITPATKGLWIETPSNPLLNLVDIAQICGVAEQHGLTSIVDNTFMTPYLQRPLDLGADIVVHSTTKYLNGHCDVVGGAVISKDSDTGDKVAALTNALGTCCSPMDAWLVLRGVKTLGCRMDVHARNALALAEFLEGRPEVECVYYPGLASHSQHALACEQMSGFGGMLSFEIQGGSEVAFRLIQRLELYEFAESLGGAASLIEHPDTMSHASMPAEARAAAGITEGTIRVSVGIESIDDLIEDMTRGLEAIGSP
jgi:O-succinylhomoserine (thiol)-lyase